MPSKQPKPQAAPFQSQQQQTNTYQPISIAETPLGQEFKFANLDFGDPVDVDPGVQQRTDLAEQEVENRYGSAFNSSVPSIIRQGNRARELREVRGQGAAEAQRARYANQTANNAMRERKSVANLGRLERLLPQVYQTSGTSNTSGFNTQFPQSQPNFWQRLALGVAQGAASGAASGFGG